MRAEAADNFGRTAQLEHADEIRITAGRAEFVLTETDHGFQITSLTPTSVGSLVIEPQASNSLIVRIQ